MPSGPKPHKDKHRFVLRHRWALGDTVLLSGLVRDIHRAYPDQFEIIVDTNWTPVWWHNPHVIKASSNTATKPQHVTVAWGEAITHNSRAATTPNHRELRHIVAWYHCDFWRKTGISVPCTEPRGELFLTDEEAKPIIEGRYWVIFSGGKLDITNKHWEVARYQQVVNELYKCGLRFVQCGATHKQNIHPPLSNCINMVGRTDNVRDLFNIIKHAEGVICPVTAAMHIAAVYQRPCVVIAGGREEPWFEWYGDGFEAFGPGCAKVAVPHKFLHTIGHLHCCDKQGCWKRRTVPLESADNTGKRSRELCKEPRRLGDGQAIAGCMDLIQPEDVIGAVMEYYDEKILPPVPRSRPTANQPVVPLAAPAFPPIQPVLLSPPVSVPGVALTRLPTTELQGAPSSPLGTLPSPLGASPGAVPPVSEPQVVRGPSLPVRQQQAYQIVPPTEHLQMCAPGSQFSTLDHPYIGGRFTVCVLCYGPHPELAKKCLGSILATIPRDRIDLRIATNQASSETVDFVRGLGPDHVYINTQNRKKYPVMREMFRDPQAPLSTSYLVWFDDDAVAIDPLWSVRLAETIIANHPSNCRMYGDKRFHDLAMYAKGEHNPHRWFQAAPWYRGAQWRVRNSSRVAPNGSCIDFAVGWFWAIGTDAIKAADIPDRRLNHNGGDIAIGAQMLQAGYRIKEFNRNKAMIWCPTKEAGGRRGFEEPFPWSTSIK